MQRRRRVKAWQIREIGEPDQAVVCVDLSPPELGPGQVRVEVACVALGYPDYLLAVGRYHDKPALPFVIGGEASGVVREVGAGVDSVVPGQRVVVAPGETVGERLAGEVVVSADLVLPIPYSMPSDEAAALFVAYQTSHMGLFRRAQLRAGEVVLVHGAAGGVGSAAVELAKAADARVIAVAGGAEKAALCRDLGADDVIDHRTEDFVARTKELTNGRGADVVYDPVGGDVFERSLRCVAVEGRVLVVGFASGIVPKAPVNHALLKNYSIVGFRTRPFRDDPVYRRQVHDDLIGLYERGSIRPRVERVAFEDVPKALVRLGNREVTGRLVVHL